MISFGVNAQTLLRVCLVVVVTVAVSVVIHTNFTLRSVEKNLPNTLLTELHSLSRVLEKMSATGAAASIAAAAPNREHIERLREDVEDLAALVVALRETYVVDNLINASDFHAVVAPAVADMRIWLAEGISGYGADSPVTLGIIEERVAGAIHKASVLNHDSQTRAQDILDRQRSRLERFLFSVNLLFVLIFFMVCFLIYLLIRQTILAGRETAAQEELRRQHDLLESLLQNLPLGVTVWDKAKNIIHLNKGFTEITGYGRADLPHLSDWPRLAYPDPLYRQQVREHWRTKAAHGGGGEYRVVCRDGAVKEVEFRATFLPDARVINTLTDVTERNRNEKALRESRRIQARSKKMKSLGLLAGGVAHDLNNILSGIVSYPELILLDLPEDDKLRKPIEIMRDSGQKATAIVQDLLTVARGVAIPKQPVPVNAVIEDYLRSPEFGLVQQFHPDISVSVSLADDLRNVIGSRVHIRKILMNLVSNGFEAIEGAGQVSITTENRIVDVPFRGFNEIKEGDYVLLSVTDQGKGIADDELERIFEPFYSKKVMGRSGTGLGLAVVWNVVQDHNGYIDVVNTGAGTGFNIYLPATRDRVAEQEIQLDISDYGGQGETILVVDDVDSQREITTGIIEKLGYQVEAVPSGEAALDHIRRQRVDLVLLDMIMGPGLNGRETYERMLRINPGQRALIASGFAETEDVKAALDLGAGRFLKKPYLIQELGLALREVLTGTAARR